MDAWQGSFKSRVELWESVDALERLNEARRQKGIAANVHLVSRPQKDVVHFAERAIIQLEL